jgi:prepilin-type N-terminal cleavage/methylation domain-containing protein
MSITTALKARREALADREAGFTLIELLVVVLIIGILAAIAIPVYLGVQNNAKDSAVKSDLANNKTAISAYITADPAGAAVPTTTNTTTLSTAYKTYGWGFTSGATFGTYTVSGTGSTQVFCLTEKSAAGGWFFVSTNQPITKSTSTATTGPSTLCGATTAW